jgi:hypothetical protein
MSIRYKGGIISATPPTLVAGAGASGAWTLEQQMQATAAGLWPVNGPFYIEDVFSTWLYTGTGATLTITNGIDLSTKGGLWWGKGRSNPGNLGGHGWVDTVRGKGNMLQSNTTVAPFTTAGDEFVTSFNTNGVTIGNDNTFNRSGELTVGWTFAKQPKFFDVLSYTGNGTTQTINHNLGAVPGFVIIRRYSGGGGGGEWDAWHRGSDARFLTGGVTGLFLNTTDASLGVTAYGAVDAIMNAAPTATTLNVKIPNYASSSVNAAGASYIAYLFAHDAGGFGLTSADNVVSCGSFTCNGSGDATVTLGYEPQWLLVKESSTTGNWWIVDNMRGFTADGSDARLYANTSGAETTATAIAPTATGLKITALDPSGTFIYIAIRRGPMKTPTVGTSVYQPVVYTGNDTTPRTISTTITPDAAWFFHRDTAAGQYWFDRLRGSGNFIRPSLTAAQSNWTNAWYFDVQNAIQINSGTSYINTSPNQNGLWALKRAPGFFDIACYTGTGSVPTVNHNLGVAPELIILKSRSGISNWPTNVPGAAANAIMYVDLTDARYTGGLNWSFTSTTFIPAGDTSAFAAGTTYVAYLFATCPGVSKVGTYTGTAALQTVNCGFTTGARFVLIKRTDSTGNWYVWDSANGISSGTDPYLLMNSAAAQVTGTNYVDTDTTGFQVTAAASTTVNISAATYIFLAIA